MKKLILMLSVIFFNSAFAQKDVELICVSSFNQEVYNLVEEYNATCLADFIWGYESVCYNGNPETLVNLMNDEFFNTQSMVVRNANLENDGSITYRGIDKMNFWSSDRIVHKCVE